MSIINHPVSVSTVLSGVSSDLFPAGHNADDVAETIVMNVLRGDVARLQRCTAIKTGSSSDSDSESIPRDPIQ